jgi:hypothetical protein
MRPLPRGRWTLQVALERGGVPEAVSAPRTLTIPGDPTLAVTGDAACDPSSEFFNSGRGDAAEQQCRMRAASDLVVDDDDISGLVMLGDIQYTGGKPESFPRSYGPTWGRLKSITRAVLGNHDLFPTSGPPPGKSYWDYFNGRGQRDGPGGPRGRSWYSFDAGWWHVVVLNSNCGVPGGVNCGPGSQQLSWLRDDLARNRSLCTLAALHHPLYTVGEVGPTPRVRPIYDALSGAGVDLVVTGHAHDYERWAPLTPSSRRDDERGLRQLVVGTAGVGLSALKTSNRNVERSSGDAPEQHWIGILRLTMRSSSYSWRFVNEEGRVRDSGSSLCH